MPTKNKLILLALLTCMTSAAVAHADDGGFWCWTHPDGQSALCARRQDQCEASRGGFNDMAGPLGEDPITDPCQWQKTAWELVTKRRVGPGHHYPTKKLCAKVRAKGDTCRLSR